MPILDNVLAQVRSITGLNLQTGILGNLSNTLSTTLGSFAGGQGILSQRVAFLNNRINAMKTQTSPVEKVKAFMNPITPSFVPKVIAPNGVLAKAGISGLNLPSFTLPHTPAVPTTTPSKQILAVPAPMTPNPMPLGGKPSVFK
jgi:hypothetical protein